MSNIVRSKFALLAGAVLAVTAGTVAYGAAQAPVPPVPPAPPTPPAPPAVGKQIVIVEKHGDANGREYVRTITRDGKTFVFQTDKALSDLEVEQRIASAEERIPPLPPVPPVADGGHRVMKQRVIVVDDRGEQVTDVVTEEADRCDGKEIVSNVDTSSEADGKLTRVRVRMCGTPGEIGKQARAQAAEGIANARAEIARDKGLPESTRQQVLKELDAELARLKRAS
ncbi:hypothetical protein [Novosphingobium sp. CECT 9465]|uniref:hypothetical protein n=1 Tax=Novosphingobium sp. CECT 9465 TaxID=2829794 RepID=UPI001E658054|nr:hypothetical protein [Novosphingobium sp. CECT 9465]CAH0496877.1 hypothetical protein NVSP9465_01925 [Novosphingobium sp. CECT 9465]